MGQSGSKPGSKPHSNNVVLQQDNTALTENLIKNNRNNITYDQLLLSIKKAKQVEIKLYF